MGKIVGVIAIFIFYIIPTFFIIFFVEWLKEKAVITDRPVWRKVLLTSSARSIEILVIAILASLIIKKILGPPGFSLFLQGK